TGKYVPVRSRSSGSCMRKWTWRIGSKIPNDQMDPDHHLPGDLREVDLVPIEEMHRAQARKEEKGCAENDVELDAQARWHGCEGRIGENAWSRFSYLWIILSWGLH